ncbi:GTP 3',8-cyclase MoaA [Alteromonas ponticola]|uniref:GTP 3',8-cyclase n=1 Tax=Alteromonas ponticola TaxID=2720613 RepID=A0ABX1R186_9ALTE|nr:GTP 3',8-cyclase MoaA [Alteromonas ponticola]NMH59356.1 GTP 3',8-cyclase MoaA [Alteromonas ponticola]
MLEDSFGRQFHYLRLSVTEACNFRCQYCLPDGYNGPSKSSFLSQSEIKTLVETFARLGTSKVRITGGEPSLRRDLPQIIETCASTRGIRKVAITTHGARLAENAERWARAGCSQVNVSIDSLDPAQFNAITGQNKLKEILAGVDKALEHGISVKINSVLLTGFSAGRLTRFLKWIKETPVSVRFIELMETGDHQRLFSQQHQSGQVLLEQIVNEGWLEIAREPYAGPAREFYHPDYAGKLGFILPYSKDFCKNCNRLRVSALGKLHLCLFSEAGIGMRGYLTDGDVEGLMCFLRQTLKNKRVSHLLEQHETGATTHFAMIGG